MSLLSRDQAAAAAVEPLQDQGLTWKTVISQRGFCRLTAAPHLLKPPAGFQRARQTVAGVSDGGSGIRADRTAAGT